MLVQRERQRQHLDQHACEQRAGQHLAQRVGAIRHQSVQQHQQGDHRGRADDEAQKPRPRQQTGEHIGADRHADSDDQHDHHHEAHQLLAHGVALRDAKNLSESELHGREHAAASPDQAADGDDTQQSGRVLHSVQRAQQLGLRRDRERRDDQLLKLRLAGRVANTQPDDGQDAKHQGEHRQQAVECEPRRVVGRLARAERLHDPDRKRVQDLPDQSADSLAPRCRTIRAVTAPTIVVATAGATLRAIDSQTDSLSSPLEMTTFTGRPLNLVLMVSGRSVNASGIMSCSRSDIPGLRMWR